MVNNQAKQLNQIFHALSDETRRKMLLLIAKKQCTVSDLAEPFTMSLPAISKHVKVLEKAGLLHRTKEGRIHHCELNAEPLREAATVIKQLQQFWDNKFDALAQFLEETTPKHTKHHLRSNRK